MRRLMAYLWFSFVMAGTAPLSDIRPILRLRGWLTRPCFRSCGQRLEIASGVRINYTTDLTLGDDVYLGPGCWINAYGGTTIDDQVMLGPYTVVVTTKHTQIDGSYRFGKPDMSPIHIGRGSWTAAHVVVSSGVRIGRGVLVAACAVVTKDVPDGCVVGGVPARVIRSGHSDEADLSTLSPDARPDVSTSQRR